MGDNSKILPQSTIFVWICSVGTTALFNCLPLQYEYVLQVRTTSTGYDRTIVHVVSFVVSMDRRRLKQYSRVRTSVEAPTYSTSTGGWALIAAEQIHIK